MAEYARDILKLKRVYAEVLEHNELSHNSMERAGYIPHDTLVKMIDDKEVVVIRYVRELI